MDLIIRQSTEGDREAIGEATGLAVAPLRRVYRPTREGLAWRKKRAALRTQLVCEVDGRAVATVEFEERGDTCYLIGPLVHPGYQRKGIARALIQRVAEVGREAGKRALALNTVKQTGNVAIFERLGFHVVDEKVADETLGESLLDEPLIDVYLERPIDC